MARMEEEEQEPLAAIEATAAAPRERLSDGLPRRSPLCSCASPSSPPSTSCCRRRTATPSPRASSPPAPSSTSPPPAPASPSASSATKPAPSSSPPAMTRLEHKTGTPPPSSTDTQPRPPTLLFRAMTDLGVARLGQNPRSTTRWRSSRSLL